MFLETAEAHTPQDAIDALAISPDYDNDATLFVVVQNYLLRSTDRGASWKQLVSGLDSPYVFSDIAVAPDFAASQAVFVATDGGGVYRSVNAGQTWARFNGRNAQANIGMLLVAPANDDLAVLAAGTARGLFASSVHEPDWRRVISDDVQITALHAIESRSSGLTFAGDSDGGVWRSDENLENWTRIAKLHQVGAITAIASDAVGSQDLRVFVGTEEAGLIEISDQGDVLNRMSASWPAKTRDCLGRTLMTSVPDQHIRDIEIRAGSNGSSKILVTTWNSAVQVSTDAGSTWQIMETGISCDNQADSYLAAVPHYRDLELGASPESDVFVAGFDGLYRSEDGGASWVQFETLPVSLIRGMDVSASNDGLHNLALTTYGGGAYISNDSGVSWVIANLGLVTTRLADIEFSTDYAATRKVFALSKERLLKRSSSNLAWDDQDVVYRGWRKRVGAGLERRLGVSADFGTRLFLSDAERRRVWPMQLELSPHFVTDETMFAGLRQHGVWVSDDGGESWDRDWEGPIDFVTAMQVSPEFSDDQTVFAGMRGQGIYVTRDSGDSWEAVNNGFEFLAEVETPTKPNYYIDPPLYSAIKDVLLVVSPNYGESKLLFASSASGLFKSSDGGMQWTVLPVALSLDSVPVNALGISPDFANDETLVVSFKGRGLFRTTDGGQTFVSIGQNLLAQNFDLKLIEFSPQFAINKTIFAATDEVLLESRDAGVSWSVIDRPVRYEDWRGEDRGPIRFVGKWNREARDDFSASTQTVSETIGAQATLNFNGTNIAWYAQRGPESGRAIVEIDGQQVADIDLFSESRIAQAEVFRSSDLERGPHNIQITVAERESSSSLGTRVSLDNLDVWTRND